jgi:hypothetical protein
MAAVRAGHVEVPLVGERPVFLGAALAFVPGRRDSDELLPVPERRLARLGEGERIAFRAS